MNWNFQKGIAEKQEGITGMAMKTTMWLLTNEAKH